jgi:glycosyltransferase involved in cell wall biosynthesis
MEPLELGVVVWDGTVGGAEVFSANLCVALREFGVCSTLVFVGKPSPLSDLVEQLGIPYVSLDLSRGSRVVLHARRFARLVASVGRDGALLQSDGYLAGALRAGGYRGRIVASEHGTLLLRQWMSAKQRMVRAADKRAGVWALDGLVAVSERMADDVLSHPHPESVLTVPNGVDLSRFRPNVTQTPSAWLRAGLAGRLVPGKGAELLIEAIARASDTSVEAVIAGDGPERPRLEDIAAKLGVADRVRFIGTMVDMPAFWNTVDVAVVPSHPPHVESFGLVAAEAMACGVPVIASRNGALPDIVLDGQVGTLIDERDVNALADALDAYSRDPELRKAHGRRARRSAMQRFDIRTCAAAYAELFRSLCDAGAAPGQGSMS